jgi:hypothetical protein
LYGPRRCCQAAGWQKLWNGKDLTGWKQVGWGNFVIEEGMLKTAGGMGLLYFENEAFENATVRVVFKTPTREGRQLRALHPHAGEAAGRLVRGAQRLRGAD